MPNTFLIFSFVYPVLSLFFLGLMFFIYKKYQRQNTMKILALFPALGILYGLVYVAIYMPVSMSAGGFSSIYVIRAFEGFAIDLIGWLAILIYDLNKQKKKPSSRMMKRFRLKIIEEFFLSHLLLI